MKATVRGPAATARCRCAAARWRSSARCCERLDRDAPAGARDAGRARRWSTAMAGEPRRRPGRAAAPAAATRALTTALLDRMGERARDARPAAAQHRQPDRRAARCDKFNVIPSEVEVVLDGRLLPGFGPDDLLRELRALVGDDVELEVAPRSRARPSRTSRCSARSAAILEQRGPRRMRDPAADAGRDRRALLRAARHPDLRLHADEAARRLRLLVGRARRRRAHPGRRGRVRRARRSHRRCGATATAA